MSEAKNWVHIVSRAYLVCSAVLIEVTIVDTVTYHRLGEEQATVNKGSFVAPVLLGGGPYAVFMFHYRPRGRHAQDMPLSGVLIAQNRASPSQRGHYHAPTYGQV